MKLLRRIARDRVALAGLIVLAVIVLAAIFAPVLAPYPQDVNTYHTAQRLLPPSAEHWFGTDQMGGDIFSRLLFGARITLITALIAVAVSVLIGVPIGLVGGYWPGFVGDGLMRVSDVFLAVPQIVLAMAIAATLGPQIQNVILALSLTYWPFWARLVYAETRNAKNEIYVEAAVALGVPPWRVMVLHILPAIAPSLIIRTSIGLGGTILVASALGFLGLGPPPPSPEWGRMIADARAFLPGAWWDAAAPGIAILVLVMAFNLIGDGLRDVLDPKLRGQAAAKGGAVD